MEVWGCLLFAPVQSEASFCGLSWDLLLQKGSPVSHSAGKSLWVLSSLPPQSCWEKVFVLLELPRCSFRGTSRLPLTSGWLGRAGAAGLHSSLPWHNGLGKEMLLWFVSSAPWLQTKVPELRAGQALTASKGQQDAGDRNWGQWEESGVQQEPQAGPCLALALLLVLCGVIWAGKAGRHLGITTAPLPLVLIVPTTEWQCSCKWNFEDSDCTERNFSATGIQWGLTPAQGGSAGSAGLTPCSWQSLFTIFSAPSILQIILSLLFFWHPFCIFGAGNPSVLFRIKSCSLWAPKPLLKPQTTQTSLVHHSMEANPTSPGSRTSGNLVWEWTEPRARTSEWCHLEDKWDFSPNVSSCPILGWIPDLRLCPCTGQFPVKIWVNGVPGLVLVKHSFIVYQRKCRANREERLHIRFITGFFTGHWFLSQHIPAHGRGTGIRCS